jgi:heptosyltransferase-3
MQSMPTPRRILVICTRRLGDALLTTPLIRSLRSAWPEARIDALTFAAAAPALVGNPDLVQVLSLREGASLAENWHVVGRLRRAYDLAAITLPSDRAHFIGAWCARRRVGVVPSLDAPGGRWKRWLCASWSVHDPWQVHAAEQALRLADGLGIPRVPWVVPPEPLTPPPRRERPYAVLHPSPMFRYKAWTEDGWRALIDWLLARGFDVVLTGGPAPAEKETIEHLLLGIRKRERVTSLAGALRFAELTPLIRGARVFVGPDTSVTHLAAATGVPTVAVFGPSSPIAWGPWPQGFTGAGDSPWTLRAPLQHRGNVWIVQGITHCVPCLGEGCDKHLNSRADCLEQMPAGRVTAVVEQALLSTPAAAAAQQ